MSISSSPMLRIAVPECVGEACDTARGSWEVEGLGRGLRSKMLLAVGRGWMPRAGLGVSVVTRVEE